MPGSASAFSITPIGVVRSAFTEKFGIPRQARLVDVAARIEVFPPYSNPDAFRGLDRFSHIWLLFLFHANRLDSWSPTVRPPRLGGNERVGVFASRSGFRPNGIGMSAVKLERIAFEANRALLDVRGADLLDGTPVVDIKPYIRYCDAITDASSGFADEPPQAKYEVAFSPRASEHCAEQERRLGLPLRAHLAGLLALDPRPAYQAPDTETATTRIWGMNFYDLNIRWRIDGDRIEVVDIARIETQ